MSNEDAKSVNTRDLRRAPRSLNGVRRDAEVRVRMTRSERALLEAKAKNLGWAMARTLLHATLHPASAQEIDTDNLAEVITDLRDYRRKLTGLANNLNQLTRYAHAKQELPKHIDDVLGQVERSVDEINYLLASVRR